MKTVDSNSTYGSRLRPPTDEQRNEIVSLLAERTIGSDRGIDVEGETIVVSASVWPAELKGGEFDVHITAYERGVGQLDLSDVPLRAGSEEQKVKISHASETGHGGLKLCGLVCRVEYRLYSSFLAIAPSSPRVLTEEDVRNLVRNWLSESRANELVRRWRALRFGTAAPASVGSASTRLDAGPKATENLRYDSDGGRMRARLTPQGRGEWRIEIETNEPDLAKTAARFQFFDDGGQILPFMDENNQPVICGEVTMADVPGLPSSLWLGRAMCRPPEGPWCFHFEEPPAAAC